MWEEEGGQEGSITLRSLGQQDKQKLKSYPTSYHWSQEQGGICYSRSNNKIWSISLKAFNNGSCSQIHTNILHKIRHIKTVTYLHFPIFKSYLVLPSLKIRNKSMQPRTKIEKGQTRYYNHNASVKYSLWLLWLLKKQLPLIHTPYKLQKHTLRISKPYTINISQVILQICMSIRKKRRSQKDTRFLMPFPLVFLSSMM